MTVELSRNKTND